MVSTTAAERCLMAVGVLLGVAPVVGLARSDPGETANIGHLSQSVAVVETDTERGAGFLVDNELVVTAAHVVSAGAVRVRFGSQSLSGRVASTDQRNDLTVIELDGAPELTPLKVASSPPEIGEEVYAVGAPTDGDLTITRGIVSAVLDGGEIQTDASVNPGNSGGPLIRSDGTVLGVITQKADAEGIGYATGADAVATLLDAPRLHADPGSVDASDDGFSGQQSGESVAPAPVPDWGRSTGSDDVGPLPIAFVVAGLITLAAGGFLVARARAIRDDSDFDVRMGPVNDGHGGT